MAFICSSIRAMASGAAMPPAADFFMGVIGEVAQAVSAPAAASANATGMYLNWVMKFS
jgi:hypothetical protein